MPIPQPITQSIVSTTGWGIPITDEVNRLTGQSDSNTVNVATLQSQLNALMNPDWAPIPLLTGFIAQGGGYSVPGYFVWGEWTYLCGVIKNNTGSTVNTPTNVATLPIEARPVSQTMGLFCRYGSSHTNGLGIVLNVTTSGTLTVYANAATPIPNTNPIIHLDGIGFQRTLFTG